MPLKMETIQCSETSAISTQTPGNHPKENLLHLTRGESLKSNFFIFPLPVLKAVFEKFNNSTWTLWDMPGDHELSVP
jgi:hypothetical protein